MSAPEVADGLCATRAVLTETLWRGRIDRIDELLADPTKEAPRARDQRRQGRRSQAPDHEMTLLTVPVVVGQGTWLFPHDGPDIALELVDSRADSKGVTIQVYRPNGRPRYS